MVKMTCKHDIYTYCVISAPGLQQDTARGPENTAVSWGLKQEEQAVWAEPWSQPHLAITALEMLRTFFKGVTYQSEGLASLRSRKGRWLWQACSQSRDGTHWDGASQFFSLKYPNSWQESGEHSYNHNNNQYPLCCLSYLSFCHAFYLFIWLYWA